MWEEEGPWATLSPPTCCTTCPAPAQPSPLHLPILSESFYPVWGAEQVFIKGFCLASPGWGACCELGNTPGLAALPGTPFDLSLICGSKHEATALIAPRYFIKQTSKQQREGPGEAAASRRAAAKARPLSLGGVLGFLRASSHLIPKKGETPTLLPYPKTPQHARRCAVSMGPPAPPPSPLTGFCRPEGHQGRRLQTEQHLPLSKDRSSKEKKHFTAAKTVKSIKQPFCLWNSIQVFNS